MKGHHVNEQANDSLRSETNIDILMVMKQVSKYWTSAHTKHRMLYHIVWIPKYRKRILQGEIAQRIKGMLSEAQK